MICKYYYQDKVFDNQDQLFTYFLRKLENKEEENKEEEKEEEKEKEGQNNERTPFVTIWKGFWTRKDVENNPDNAYLFGDNIEDAKTGYVPSSTQAVIRGLPNAFGIPTKFNRRTNADSYLSDEGLPEFKEIVNNVIAEALDYVDVTGGKIIIPEDGIGTGKAMLKEKAPKLFEYLNQKLKELAKYSETVDGKVKNNTVTYTPKGKSPQKYTIDGEKILNSKGIEVFKTDSADRRRIFANFAIKQGDAVIVPNVDGINYVVFKDGRILTTAATGKANYVFEDKKHGVGIYLRNKADEIFKESNFKKSGVSEIDYDTVLAFIEKNEMLLYSTINSPNGFSYYIDKFNPLTNSFNAINTETNENEIISLDDFINMVGYHLELENESPSTPSVNPSEEIEVELPVEKDLSEFMTLDKKGIDIDGPIVIKNRDKVLDVIESFGFDRTKSSKENYKLILETVLSDSDSDLQRYIAKQYLKNIDKFEDISFIIDFNLNGKARVSTDKEGTGTPITIRLNPSKITTKEDFFTTMLEELSHVATIKEINSSEQSESVRRIKDLQQQAIAFYGKEKFEELSTLIQRRDNLLKKRKVQTLTKDEQDFLDDPETRVSSEDRRIIYRLSNTDEFVVAVLMDTDFQEYLNTIKETDTNKTVYQKVLNVIASIIKKFIGSVKESSILKYAIYDALQITADGLETKPFLLGKYARSINFVENKLKLTDENGNKMKVKNADEVVDFINNTFSNLVAYKEEDNTINITYLASLSANSIEVSNHMTAKELLDDEDSLPDFEDDDDLERKFQLQVKGYIVNLNHRIETLAKSNKLIKEDTVLNERVKLRKIEDTNKLIIQLKQQRKDIHKKLYTSLFNFAAIAKEEIDHINLLRNKQLNSSDIVYMLQTLKFWQGAKSHLFLKENYLNNGLVTKYDKIEQAAGKTLGFVYNTVDKYLLKDMVGKHTNFKGTVEELAREFADTKGIDVYLTNLTITDSSLLQSIALEIKKQNVQAQREEVEEVGKFVKALEKAKPILRSFATNKRDLYEILRQKDEYGNITMNIVTPTTAYYQSKRKILNFVYNEKSNKSKEDAYEAHNFLHKFTVPVKYSVLFPDKRDIDSSDLEKIKEERNRLIDIMGEEEFNKWYIIQKEKIDSYIKVRDFTKQNIFTKYKIEKEEDLKSVPAAYLEYKNFLERNDIYLLEDKLANPKTGKNSFTAKLGYQVFKYVEDIPKKQIPHPTKENETVSAYDSNYDIIKNNAELKEFYDYIFNILGYAGNIIPYETGEKLAYNAVPEFKYELYEKFLQKGFKLGFDGVKEMYADMLGTEKTKNQTAEIDILTNKERKTVGVGLDNSNIEISNKIKAAKIKYQVDNGFEMSEEEERKLKSEIKAEFYENNTFDLGFVLEKYLKLAIAYKHKTKIEDNITLANDLFHRLKETERTNRGELKIDKLKQGKGNVPYVEKAEGDSFTNLKAATDHTINSIMYNDSKNVSSEKTKVYTPLEKEFKAYLEDLLKELESAKESKKIDSATYISSKKEINSQLDSLGRYKDTEKRIDMLIKYTQMKGMGWNITGGISNMFFGYVANFIEGSGNQIYSNDELFSAYKFVMANSMIKSALFNNYAPDNAVKIRSLMDNFNIMSSNAKEFHSMYGETLADRLKFLSIYNINERTEYMNQAPLMVVMFKKHKFKHNGKEYSLYDGFNRSGVWNEEEFGPEPVEVINDVVLKIKHLVERNHGNYNPLSPMLAKRSSAGRLLMQFRSWMETGYRTRIEKERFDPIFKVNVKGSYRSAYHAFKVAPAQTSLALALNILRLANPFKNGKNANSTPIDKIFKDNKEISEVDIANLKKVSAELFMLIGVYMFMLIVKNAAEGLDDDDPKKYAINFLLNQGTRVRTDILLYINPLEIKKLINDPIPSVKVLSDIAKFKDAVEKTITGNPDYQSGIYKDHNRILRTMMLNLPGTSQFYKTGSNVLQTIED